MRRRILNCYLEGVGVPQDIPKAIEWLTKAAENDDVDAMILLGQYYFNQNTGDGLIESNQWLEKAANRGSIFAMQMAAEGFNLQATVGMKVAQKTGAWERALEEWRKSHQWAVKWRDGIDAGHPDADVTSREDAVRCIEKAAFFVGLCCRMMDRYTEAIQYVRDGKSIRAQLLYGVCLFDQSKQLDNLKAAYEKLRLVETDDSYYLEEKTAEEELVYAAAAVNLSTIYRLGLPNAVRVDLNAAVDALQKVRASIQDSGYLEIIEKELRHYKKTMFGGYKYIK